MLNRKYYSFERNNYYYGKLLTSKDFQQEQGYLNDKRRLINKVLHGSGIVYGLDVVSVDDLSIILQSGFALDGSGREIVVPATQVVKISTIDGFDSLKSNCAYLGISYQEEGVDPVYSTLADDSSEDENKKFNSIHENYKLYLMDEADCVYTDKKEDAFFTKSVIYMDQDIRVVQIIPTYAVKGKNVKVRLEIEKTSYTSDVFSVTYDLQTEGFVERDMHVAAENISLEFGKTVVYDYILTPEDYVYGNTEIVVKSRNIEIVKNGNVEKRKDEFKASIAPVLESVLECVLKNSYKGTMDAELDATFDEKLFICKISLIRSGNNVLIDHIEDAPFKQYVYNADQLMIMNKLDDYLVDKVKITADNKPVITQQRISESTGRETERTLASGSFDMSLGNGGEVGKAIFSEEIMHGLGSGPVYVEIGVEYLYKSSKDKAGHEEIILGDNSIFSSVEDSKVYQIDTAVKVLPERGTFIVGVRPKVKTGKISLRIRWYAFKPEDLEKKVTKLKEQQGTIMIQPDTIVLPPKATVHINPVFVNMAEEPLAFSLLDSEGGKVDNNGMYTAPAQEGVYEVKVSCISNPEIYTHAFMIVSQKKSDEE